MYSKACYARCGFSVEATDRVCKKSSVFKAFLLYSEAFLLYFTALLLYPKAFWLYSKAFLLYLAPVAAQVYTSELRWSLLIYAGWLV